MKKKIIALFATLSLTLYGCGQTESTTNKTQVETQEAIDTVSKIDKIDKVESGVFSIDYSLEVMGVIETIKNLRLEQLELFVELVDNNMVSTPQFQEKTMSLGKRFESELRKFNLEPKTDVDEKIHDLLMAHIVSVLEESLSSTKVLINPTEEGLYEVRGKNEITSQTLLELATEIEKYTN